MSKPAPSSIIGEMVPTVFTVPFVGLRIPEITFSKVLFPEPFKPTMPKTSPCSIVTETSFSAKNCSK